MAENLKLVEALEAMGTRARPVIGGLFQAEFLQRDVRQWQELARKAKIEID